MPQTTPSAPANHVHRDGVAFDGQGRKPRLTQTEKLQQQYPHSFVGSLLGAGVLMGAIAQRLIAHAPTLSEAMRMNSLPVRLRRSLKRWL